MSWFLLMVRWQREHVHCQNQHYLKLKNKPIISPLHHFLRYSHLLILIRKQTPFLFNCDKQQLYIFPIISIIISCYTANKRNYIFPLHKNPTPMNNPTYKTIRQRRNQLSAITTLILGKQPSQSTNYRQIKQDTPKQSKIINPKYINKLKLQQIHSQLNFLKINGKEINGMTMLEYKPLGKNIQKTLKYIPPDNKIEDLPLPAPLSNNQPNIYMKQGKPCYDNRKQFSRSHPNITLSYEPSTQKIRKNHQNLHENYIKESISSYTNSSNKQHTTTTFEQQKSLPQIIERPKLPKRKDTIQKIPIVQQSQKQKMDLKKSNNYLLFRQFILTINLTNNLVIFPQEQVLYKAYICKGNNGLLVKSILKTRPWWSFKPLSEIDGCNLIWTEWKRNKSINILPNNKHKEVKEIEVSPPFTHNNPKNNKENKDNKQKIYKKMNNFTKIIGKNLNLLSKLDENPSSQTYLTFSHKFNHKTFQQYLTKNLIKDEYDVCLKNYQKSLVNHIPGCYYLHSKKFLFISMRNYYQKLQKDIFSVIPTTFLISKGVNDPQFQKFTKYFEELSKKQKNNIWICKPGQNSNRGNGIDVVSTLSQIRSIITQKCTNNRTLIIQKYMQNPFLYNKRKFDIRCYILITCVNGVVKGYWYEQGYVRTTSKEYTLKNLDNKLIHLTNDAIQKKGQEYGKFQNFNKVSFGDLEKYIQSNTEYKFKPVYEKIKSLAVELILSVAPKINPQHKQFTFQVFGLDFMLDDKLNPYLIQANSNPCLSVDGNVLAKVIPPMLQNLIRVAIDPLFPPPKSQSNKNRFNPGNTFEINRMMLVYDSLFDFPIKFVEDQPLQVQDKECEQFQGEIQE